VYLLRFVELQDVVCVILRIWRKKDMFAWTSDKVFVPLLREKHAHPYPEPISTHLWKRNDLVFLFFL